MNYYWVLDVSIVNKNITFKLKKVGQQNVIDVFSNFEKINALTRGTWLSINDASKINELKGKCIGCNFNFRKDKIFFKSIDLCDIATAFYNELVFFKGNNFVSKLPIFEFLKEKRGMNSDGSISLKKNFSEYKIKKYRNNSVCFNYHDDGSILTFDNINRIYKTYYESRYEDISLNEFEGFHFNYFSDKVSYIIDLVSNPGIYKITKDPLNKIEKNRSKEILIGEPLKNIMFNPLPDHKKQKHFHRDHKSNINKSDVLTSILNQALSSEIKELAIDSFGQLSSEEAILEFPDIAEPIAEASSFTVSSTFSLFDIFS